MSIKSRFWAKVDKSGGPDACWTWTASKTKDGYGQFGVGGKVVLAHRFSYELEHGPIPNGLCACHRCDNPGCVNPAHVFLGTNSDNVADREAKGRGNPARGDRNGSRTHPECLARGERNGSVKLTPAKVQEIRSAYAAGDITQTELGARFGVSQMTISDIVRKKKWKTGPASATLPGKALWEA